jgi:hypothetical protein
MKVQATQETSVDATSLDRPNRQRHLLTLGEGEWGLWKWAAVRGAGFEANGVLKLASPLCAASADKLIEAEEAAERLWLEAIEALNRDLATAEGPARKALVKVMDRLKLGKAPRVVPADCGSRTSLEMFVEVCNRAAGAWSEYERAFETASADSSTAIREIAEMPRVREAVTWQNRAAVRTAIEPLLDRSREEGKANNQHQRQHEEMIALYWQRYCVKNDTIGFFGPVGWASLTAKDNRIHVQPGQHLLAERNVYFDSWCIDKLAEVISGDEDFKREIAPRVSPDLLVDGTTAKLALKEPFELGRLEIAVLERCDGRFPARRLASSLIEEGAAEAEDDVFRVLREMEEHGLIYWALEVPWPCEPRFHWRIEELFRARTDSIEDPLLRERALSYLEPLDAARTAIAAAAGDTLRLGQALEQLETSFTSLTGAQPTRSHGRMYAGRTLVYEDCLRDIGVQIGRKLLDELWPPLSLILTSARWYAFEISRRLRHEFAKIHARLANRSGSPAVDFHQFWAEAQAGLFGKEAGLIAGALGMVQERWAEVLELQDSMRAQDYSSAQLRPRILESFVAPGPGWQYGRYHSPDVMIAAASADAIERGDYHFVLGELHVAANTINKAVFAAQHPSPDELYRCFELDMDQPQVIPVAPKHLATQRAYSVFVSARDYRLEFGREVSDADESRRLRIGSLSVEPGRSGLIVRSRDGRFASDIIEAMGFVISERISDGFRILPQAAHTPRVSIDKLVVSRESWRFQPSGLEFAWEKDDKHRFAAARRWARQNSLPRYVFVKTGNEVKPCFVDFESPIYVSMMARFIRRAGAASGEDIAFVEMLPGPHQAWLPDAEGKRYASELRLVTVDQTQPQMLLATQVALR